MSTADGLTPEQDALMRDQDDRLQTVGIVGSKATVVWRDLVNAIDAQRTRIASLESVLARANQHSEERIVTWLRVKHASEGRGAVWERIADAIERGEHRGAVVEPGNVVHEILIWLRSGDPSRDDFPGGPVGATAHDIADYIEKRWSR